MNQNEFRTIARERGFPDPVAKDVEAGMFNPRHVHDQSRFVFVEAGRFVVEIFDGDTATVADCGPGQTVEVPAGVEHTEATGDDGAHIVVTRK